MHMPLPPLSCGTVHDTSMVKEVTSALTLPGKLGGKTGGARQVEEEKIVTWKFLIHLGNNSAADSPSSLVMVTSTALVPVCSLL